MRILNLTLRNFRCFPSLDLEFTTPLTLITGPNGTGKTSIIEALHYLCYLKSFKAASPKELILLDRPGCSISAQCATRYALDNLQVTVTDTRRTIKINKKAATSYKELYALYKAVTLIEEDLAIIKGAPLSRRTFIDQCLSLLDPTYLHLLRKYRHILHNRNALLASTKPIEHDLYCLWTEQLWTASMAIQRQRVSMLAALEQHVRQFSPNLEYVDQFAIIYESARSYALHDTSTQFLAQDSHLLHQEKLYKRTLFGAHLDDYTLLFQDKSARTYASRGQQKLIILLLKLAQAQLIIESEPHAAPLFLIDDFLTDLDDAKIITLVPLIRAHAAQVIVSCALTSSSLQNYLFSQGATHIDTTLF